MYFKDEAKSNLYMDEANSIFRIHKSGKGDVERFPLYIDGEYLEGNLRNNGFYVVARPKNDIAKLHLNGTPVFIDLENNPPYMVFFEKK